MPLSGRLENFRTPFYQACVHRSPFGHGLEERVVRLAQMKVQKSVGRKTPTASEAAVAVRRLVVRLVLQIGDSSRVGLGAAFQTEAACWQVEVREV